MERPKRNPNHPMRNPNLLPTQTFLEPHFNPYALAIGQANLAWNSLHEALGLVFWALTGEEHGALSLRIWNELNNDRAKRDLLLAASRVAFEVYDDNDWKKRKPDLEKPRNDAIDRYLTLKFLFDKTKSIEEDRNNAIHAPLVWHLLANEIKPATHQGNARAKKLNELDVLLEFKKLHASAIVLRDYALIIEKSLRDEPSTWPQTPKLPDQGGSKKNPRSRQAPPSARSRQPRS